MTPPLPRLAVSAVRAGDLEVQARRYARLTVELAETRITALAVEAIAVRRIDDAVFWQRVKFRSRLLRAIENS